jgi:hypothetical protein
MNPRQPLGERWVGPAFGLTHEQFETWERAVSNDPDNLCARGLLIAFGPLDQERRDIHLTRVDHLVWMIQHHPEWDGFSLEPFHGLEDLRPRHELDGASYKRLTLAWLMQLGQEQRSGMALHNAAMFFAIREPEFAAGLLKRAIALEPAEDLYVERLGVVYAFAQVRTERLVPYGVANTPQRVNFARQAREFLRSSDNWILVKRAALALWHCGCDVDQVGNELMARADTLPGKTQIPSWSEGFRKNRCNAVIRTPVS